MKLFELIQKMGAKVCCNGSDVEITGCYIGDLLSLAMSRVQEGNVWITVQTNINTAAVASLTEAACILLAEGLEPDANTAQKAAEEGICILSVDKGAYQLAVEMSEMI